MTGGAGAVWILTGMSGAGKAAALAILETLGFCCIDNLPPSLLGQLDPDGAPGIAVVIDARRATALGSATESGAGSRVSRVMFLDARDEVLARRLSESVRPHPMASAGGTPAAIAAERIVLEPLRAAADVVVDTSALSIPELRERIVEIAGRSAGGAVPGMVCTVSSFGFKYGPQIEADWVIDARLLRNPFWDPGLRPLTGVDPAVVEYIFGQPPATEFVERITDVLGWTVEQAVAHGRFRMHVAIGCTGGRHRSVAVAIRVAGALRERGVEVVVRHRDLERPDPR